MAARINLVGNSYGRGRVLKEAPKAKNRQSMWFCVCECGTFKIVNGYGLTSGGTKSCGCFAKERAVETNTTHNMRQHYLYPTWASMKSRCLNKNTPRYDYWGGRGIKIFPKWINDSAAFMKWVLKNLGERPKGCSLDRINNDGDYAPGNLRWATAKEQSNNRRRRGNIFTGE